jgi:Mitochondrial carrier protein
MSYRLCLVRASCASLPPLHPLPKRLKKPNATVRRHAAPLRASAYTCTHQSRPAQHHDPDPFVDDALSHSPRPCATPLVASAAAGIIGWIATLPFDVLKTRLQAGAITTIGTDTGLVAHGRTRRMPSLAEVCFGVVWCPHSYAPYLSKWPCLVRSKVPSGRASRDEGLESAIAIIEYI